MHSWEVVCVEVSDEREFTDCRGIETVGFRAPSLRTKPADTVASRIQSGLSDFHVTVDGERVPLQASNDEDVNMYPHVLEENSPDDPLLGLPSCERYARDQEFANLR